MDKSSWTDPGRRWLADLAAAVMFLTRLPVGCAVSRPPVWPRLMRAFPLAGALIGALSAAILTAAAWLNFNPPIAALLAVAAGVIVTGALHEDGLADCADALGAHDKKRRLEIMRDSRVGTFGVLALIVAVGLNVSALSAILSRVGAMPAAAALVAAHALSRLMSVWTLHYLPPARAAGRAKEAGWPSAAILAQAALAALAICLAVFLPLWSARALLAAAFMALVAGGVVIKLAARLLGGQTGDVAGAAEMLARTAFLLALTIS